MNFIVRNFAFFSCFLLITTAGYTQKLGEKVSVLGSDNISSVVKSSLNAIPNLRVASVSDNFEYLADYILRKDENTYNYSYRVAGYLTIDGVEVTMTDGTIVKFENKEGVLRTYNDLFVKNGYSGWEMSIIVWIDGTSTVSGLRSSFTKCLVPPKHTTALFTVGHFDHSAGGKYIGINCSGLNPGIIPNIKSQIEMVRKKYDQIKSSQQKLQNATNNGSAGGNNVPPAANLTLSATTNNTSGGGNNAPSVKKPSSPVATKKPAAEKRPANSNTQPKKTYTFNGKQYTYEQLEYEKKRYQEQQKQKVRDAIDPAGQILRQSGIKDYFNAELDRTSRERDEKSAALDRKLAAQRRAREAREREKQQELEERKTRLVASHNESAQELRQEYQTKGGDANYMAQLNQWRAMADKAVAQINSYLLKYKGQTVGFKIPGNNCDYVQLIENIQNNDMPVLYKSILIKNVMIMRAGYNTVFQKNGLYDETNRSYYGPYSDNLTWNTYSAQCGNYLDYIYNTLDNDNTYRNYGADVKWVIKNKYDRFDNYSIVIGRYNQPTLFLDEVRKAGIFIVDSYFDDRFAFEKNVINYFHLEPRIWSTKYGYNSDDSKLYFSIDTDSMKINLQVDRFEKLYDLKRKYALNTVENELDMAFFMYHTGNVDKAYHHFLRYCFMYKYGTTKKDLWYFLHNDVYSDSDTEKFYQNELQAAILGIILYTEKKEYDKALQLLNMLEEYNNKSKRDWGSNSKATVSETVNKLRNEIYYLAGRYDKMQLVKSKDELKQLLKNAKEIPNTKEYLIFQDLPIQANAWIKLGNAEMAKNIYDEYKDFYYNKKDKSFHGRVIDFEAFDEASKVLFPKKKIEIEQYKLVGYNIFSRWFAREDYKLKKTLVRYSYLTRSGFQHNIKADRITIDLTTDEEYNRESMPMSNLVLKTDMSKMETAIGVRQKMYALYEKTYNRGSIVKNDKYEAFLLEYINTGLVLGKFHEVIPLIVEFEENYPKRAAYIHLQKNLAKLMWHTTANGDLNGTELKTYFEESLLTMLPEYLKLQNLLSLWSYQKLSSASMPYLYSIAELREKK